MLLASRASADDVVGRLSARLHSRHTRSVAVRRSIDQFKTAWHSPSAVRVVG